MYANPLKSPFIILILLSLILPSRIPAQPVIQRIVDAGGEHEGDPWTPIAQTGADAGAVRNGVPEPASESNVERAILGDDGFVPLDIHRIGGSYLVTGYLPRTPNLRQGFGVMRIGEQGETEPGWRYTLGNGDEQSHSLVTADGGLLLTGYTVTSDGDRVAYAVKTDSTGAYIWSTVLPIMGGTIAMSVCETPDRGFVFSTGWFDSLEHRGGKGYSLTKIDSLGNILWAKGMQTYLGKSISQIRATRDGGLIVTGSSSAGANNSLFLARFDSAGTLLWTRNIFTSAYGNEHGFFLDELSDGFLIAGWVWEPGYDDTFNNLLLRVDTLGRPLGARVFGSNGYDGITSMTRTRDGNYLIAGSTSSFPPGLSPYLMKADSLGTIFWSNAFRRKSRWTDAWAFLLTSALETPDGDIRAVGVFGYDGPVDPTHFHFISANRTGVTTCEQQWLPVVSAAVEFESSAGENTIFRDLQLKVTGIDIRSERIDFTSEIVCGPEVAAVTPERSSSAAIAMHPNPAEHGSMVWLSFSSPITGASSIVVSGMTGNEVLRMTVRSGENRVPIETGALPAGIYIVSVRHAGGIAHQKLVVH